ncbi:MAG: peptidoglycan recognition family protein [Planctomycetota bacterium]|nr:peptidoglycan recognition family protein [Planctomycetota bacterium]MDA1105876.1 peptidoglycan recognition family protein [Planctomycetota bacterium]
MPMILRVVHQASPAIANHRRARIVWTSLISASTMVVGALLLSESSGTSGDAVLHAPFTPPAVSVVSMASAHGASATDAGVAGPVTSGTDQSIAPRGTALAADRWKTIVIHHSGTPGGTPESIARQHVEQGRAGLGHHFLVGNGSGLWDGAIHVGYRWDRQLPGAHLNADFVTHPTGTARPVSLTSSELLDGSISICLVGDGDRREFTERQLHEVLRLVTRLQRELGIPAERVYLGSDLKGSTGPGVHFPAAWFESNLDPQVGTN